MATKVAQRSMADATARSPARRRRRARMCREARPNRRGRGTKQVQRIRLVAKLAARIIAITLAFAERADYSSLGDYPAGAARERGDAAVVFQGYLKAAEEGDVSAQHDLGVLYAAGEGVAQDFGEALSWWRKAAAQGNAAAQYNIGAEGWGVPPNKREAVSHWWQAAEQGHSGAQYTRISDLAVVPSRQDQSPHLDFWGSDVGYAVFPGAKWWRRRESVYDSPNRINNLQGIQCSQSERNARKSRSRYKTGTANSTGKEPHYGG